VVIRSESQALLKQRLSGMELTRISPAIRDSMQRLRKKGPIFFGCMLTITCARKTAGCFVVLLQGIVWFSAGRHETAKRKKRCKNNHREMSSMEGQNWCSESLPRRQTFTERESAFRILAYFTASRWGWRPRRISISPDAPSETSLWGHGDRWDFPS